MFFLWVVQLREAERQLQLQCSDMDVRVKEQERIIGELGRGLQQSEIKAERKLMEQQRDYEQKIHFLLHKANESDVDGPNDSRIQYVSLRYDVTNDGCNLVGSQKYDFATISLF